MGVSVRRVRRRVGWRRAAGVAVAGLVSHVPSVDGCGVGPLLAAYKDHKRKYPTRLLENEDLAEEVGAPSENYPRMLAELRQTPTGKEHADEYHAKSRVF